MCKKYTTNTNMGKLIKAITKENNARLYCVDTKDIVGEAKKIHETSLTATAAFGRMLTAAVLMGADLKNERDLITLKLDVDGLVRKIIVTANKNGDVKGDIYNPVAEVPLNTKGKLDVAGIVGKGTITVIKDIGMKHPYSGISPIVSGEIGEDLSYYFYHSEQIPSVVGLGVLVNNNEVISSGGFLIQLLPGAKDEFIDKLEAKVNKIGSITDLFNEMSVLDVLKYVMKDVEEFEILDEMDTVYRCNCDKDRFYRGIITLGREEIDNLFKNEDNIEVSCNFCKKKYSFIKHDFNSL